MTAIGERVNSLTGIYVAKVDRVLMVKALTALGATPDNEESLDALSLQLWSKYNDLPKNQKIRCTNCKAVADNNLDVCPFCGHDEGEEVDLPAPKVNGKSHGKAEAQSMDQTAATEEPKKKKGKKEATLVVNDDMTPSSAIRTVRELDAAVEDVLKIGADTAGSYWTLGRRIADIHEQQLWKLRTETNEKGKVHARWKTWESFCHAELHMSPKGANRAMDSATHYTEEQVRLWGRTKLDLLLQAPPEERPRLMDEVEKGASKREIEKEVRKVKSKAGFTRESRGSHGGKTDESQTRPKAEKSITVATILGTKTVKAYCKPDSMKNVDWKDQKRAKKLADLPVGVLELINGVNMIISLQESSGGELVFKVVTQRDE